VLPRRRRDVQTRGGGWRVFGRGGVGIGYINFFNAKGRRRGLDQYAEEGRREGEGGVKKGTYSIPSMTF
jgi:hypothetical protein